MTLLSLPRASVWTGRRLHEALCETPQLTLTFYSYGILLRKPTPEGGTVEYAVDATQVAQALATQATFSTGILSGDVLLLRQSGVRQTLIRYRAPQKTGIWLEGSDEPLRLPLPPLVLIRHSNGEKHNHALFAVKTRPTTLDAQLFHAPLPNVYPSGGICWGSVRHDDGDDWTRLFGTPFGNHAVANKSRQHPQDVRAHLLTLANGRTYPKRDLIATGQTLSQWLEKEGWHG